jgi:DNA-binding transcriptional ArsR family regulator
MDSTEQRFAALEERVAALEADRTLVDHLRERVGDGDISYAGSVGFGGREYVWAKDHAAADILAADWTRVSRTLESLGSPARLTLLAALLRAPRNRAELHEALGDTSTGHLYHHLRELQAAGLISQRRRGEYEIAPQVPVPLLVIVASALDLDAGEPVDPA